MATTEEMIQTIEDNVPKVYEAGQTSVLSKCANALIGEKVGNSIVFEDLSPIQDTIKVSVESKNLVPAVYYSNKDSNVVTISGVTFTTNADGSITMNGTFDDSRNISFFLANDSKNPFVLPKGTYIGSTGVDFANISYMPIGGAYDSFSKAKTFLEETKIQYLYVNISKWDILGRTFNGETIYPMLMRGEVCEDYVQPLAAGTAVTVTCGEQVIETAVGETVTVSDVENGTEITVNNRAVLVVEYNKNIKNAFSERDTEIGKIKETIVKQYELIEEITLEEKAATFRRDFGKDGEAYNLSALRVSVKIPTVEGATSNQQLIFSFNTVTENHKLYHQANGAFSASSETNTYLVAKNDHGVMDYYVTVCTGNAEYNPRVKANYVNLPWKNIVRLSLSTYPSTVLLPVGTKITIYGIKENTNAT